MIYIVAHKEFPLPKLDDSYVTIFVGGQIRNKAIEQNVLYDKKNGSFIADKNPNYCELTALYWIWKNDHTSKYVGLNHYRRYFISTDGSIITEQEYGKILKEYDLIATTPIAFIDTVRINYFKTTGYIKDIQLMEKVVDKLYPEYTNALETFLDGHTMSYANMFIMPQEEFQSYSKWLFDILFEMEKYEDMTGYTIQEKRLYGYLGELLLNVWIIKNKLKCKYLDVCNIDSENTSKYQTIKANLILKLKNMIKFVLYFPSGIPFRRRRTL